MDDIIEEWEYIEELENRYAFSSFGRVYSYSKKRVLKTQINSYDQEIVSIMKNGDTRTIGINGLFKKYFPNHQFKLLDNHVWIEGYENLYSIDKLGNVYSYRCHRFKKLQEDFNGYLYVNLNLDYEKNSTKIHSLLLETFISPRPYGMVARHYPDSNKKNNSLDNLCWGTCAQNTHDRFDPNCFNSAISNNTINQSVGGI